MVVTRQVLEHTGDSRYRYQVGQWRAAREPGRPETGETGCARAARHSDTSTTSSSR